jgi:cyclohexanecarboxylate-CoA ligase
VARQEKSVDPAAGPLQAFAYELRKVRADAGSPAYRVPAAPLASLPTSDAVVGCPTRGDLRRDRAVCRGMTDILTSHDASPHAALRASVEAIARYRPLGLWRPVTVLDDLQRHRLERPGEVALIARRRGAPTERLTWARYAATVERYASGLRALGVGPGQVVAVQLPNWWETAALIVACFRVGAIAAPVITSIRSRELEKMLAHLRATVMVTVGRWDGYDHAAGLAEMAGRLPALRHRVVLGQTDDAGALHFQDHFTRTEWAERFPMPLAASAVDPDRAALVLFTSGTTGEPKAVVHTLNTLHAGGVPIAGDTAIGAGDVMFNPHSLTHIFGVFTGIAIPLFRGVPTVLLDTWDPGDAATAVEADRVTMFTGAPVFVQALLDAAKRDRTDLSSLRTLFAAAAPVPPDLVHEVFRRLGVPLRAAWGMTEVPCGTWTRTGMPPDFAAGSDGGPGAAAELDLRPEEGAGNGTARLFVRGAAVCLARVGRDTGTVEVPPDGWLDTGDLVVSDGAGGIRIVGRVADRIGRGFMIPVRDVEEQLAAHPAVADVAVVGYTAADGHEDPCAVIVPAGAPPTLAELRSYLTGLGMTEWYQPTRVEPIGALPRNANGKVLKEQLRGWLRTGFDEGGPDGAGGVSLSEDRPCRHRGRPDQG